MIGKERRPSADPDGIPRSADPDGIPRCADPDGIPRSADPDAIPRGAIWIQMASESGDEGIFLKRYGTVPYLS